MLFFLGFWAMGCTSHVTITPDASTPPPTGGNDIIAVNPTVNYLIDQALTKETYVYASTHPIFKDSLMVQYQESGGNPDAFKLILDDGGGIKRQEVISNQIFSCNEGNVSFQNYLDVVVPQDALVQHAVYEINSDQMGSEKVPNIVEIIFERQVAGMLRLSDTRISKSVCFDLLSH